MSVRSGVRILCEPTIGLAVIDHMLNPAEVTIAAAARRLGVDEGMLTAMAEAGQLAARSVALVEIRSALVLRPETIEQLHAQLARPSHGAAAVIPQGGYAPAHQRPQT